MTAGPLPHEDAVIPDLTGLQRHHRGPEGMLTPRAYLITAAVGFVALAAGAATSTWWVEAVGASTGWLNLTFAAVSWSLASTTDLDASGVRVWQRLGPPTAAAWDEVRSVQVRRRGSRLVLVDHRQLVMHGVPRKVALQLAATVERRNRR